MRKVYPHLWRFCFALTGSKSEADDLAQTTALRAMEKASSYKAGTHLERWLFVMARRIWLNEIRSRSRRAGGGFVFDGELDFAETTLDTETNIFARQVLDKMMKLPEAQRETVFLVYVEGYAYREAAEMLEIPIGTVMSRLAAARKSLTSSLSENETGTFG